MSWFISALVALLLISGAFFSLAAAIGINRFPDLYTRMHAASKAGTVGSGLLLLAVGLHAFDPAIFARAFAGFVFVVLTAPVSAHLLAKASRQVGYRLSDSTVRNDIEENRKLN